MALNLSTLTSPATSGDVLAEALTTADFLEGVPVLRNLARGSQKGGDAKQSVSLNQPRALPLIKNPQGNLGGYLYIPDVAGNYATGPSVTIGANETWEAEVDMVVTQWSADGNYFIFPFGGGNWNSGFGLIFYGGASAGYVRGISKGIGSAIQLDTGVTLGTPFTANYGYNGTDIFVDIDGSRVYTATAGDQSGSITHPIQLNQQTSLSSIGNYAIQKAKLTVNSSVVFDCDFNGSTSIRHGDTKFQASVGGVVSIASPELLTNGNFDTDTAWTKTGGWSIADGVATLASVSGNSELGSTVISVTAGKTYKIVVNVIATSGSFRLYDTAGVVAYSLSVGENVYSRVATGSTFQVIPLSLGSGTATIDSISVTEVSPDAKRDPITVIKKPVLRFDGANNFLSGVFNQTITGSSIFMAYSVLGDGGVSGRLLGLNSTGANDNDAGGYFLARDGSTTNVIQRYNGGSNIVIHAAMYDDAVGDVLLEANIKNGSQISKLNNANQANGTTTVSGALSSEEFKIASFTSGSNNAAIDLEYLALFPATITDAQADSVRNYINNRNNVFLRHDTDGYYFFDPQKATFTGNFTDANTLDGYITGSDLGDTDVRSNLTLVQATLNDQPSTDGYTITFNDTAEHLEFDNAASQTLAGWQVVGTSLGTFAYRVNANAVTELNLLGNAGGSRSIGELYGIILLPASATGKDIEDARKLLIDRGAADSVSVSSVQQFWQSRNDIVEFKQVDTSSVTSFREGWRFCASLEIFPPLQAPNCTNFLNAWEGNSSLNSFGAIDASSGTTFTNAWKSCSALTSFPSGAKLGTEAANVNFTSAWQSSGLTSFPSDIDLSNGVTFLATWNNTNISSFPLLNLNNGREFALAWRNNSLLTDWPAGFFDNWNPSSIASGVFNDTWDGCNLTAQSVENILTSIDASGKYGTATGASGGGSIDSGIDIDYDGTTLSAATNAAIDSLSGKGWEVFINGVLVIPNILDLAPAAAYSLRSFDADADPNVVNVRRSSDGATSDFTASEVSDGTLTTWVNAVNPQVMVNPDITSASNWTSGSNTTFNSSTEAFDLANETGLTVRQGTAIAGQTYQVTLVISSFTSGGVKIYAGGTQSDPLTSAGTHVIQITAGTSNSILGINPNGTATASIASFHAIQTTADGHVTTWYDQGGTNHATQSTASSQPKLVDGGTLVTEGGLPALNFPTGISNLGIAHSDLYGQATLDSYYVTATTDAQYLYPALLADGGRYGWVAEQGNGSGGNGANYGSGVLYANGTLVNPSTRGDVYNALSDHSLAVHQGASTTHSAWGTSGMNFGTYQNSNSIYSYTGKLQEMIFFNTDQSANRTGIENNINDTYTIY